MESWRKFTKETMHYRLVVNQICLLSEQAIKDFPLSIDELTKIKQWAKLRGEPTFLGSGTMGSAYLFDDNKVLKITSDTKEAQAAKLIEGFRHPNVYHVSKVARRWIAGEPAPSEEPRRPYIIIYDMVGEPGLINFPTREQRDVISQAENSILRNKTWTNWTSNFDRAKENFLKAAHKVDLGDVIIQKNKSEELKLDNILKIMEGEQKDKNSIKLAFITTAGLYGNNLNDVDNIIKVTRNKKFNYVNDLASGLTFLKERGITFTDLKASNVMNVNDRLVIIDIGKSGIRGFANIDYMGDEK